MITDQVLSDGQIIVKNIQPDLTMLDSAIVHHHDSMYEDPAQQRRVDWVIAHAAGEAVLEVGTATGHIISKVGASFRAGMDNNIARLLLAKMRYSDIDFYYANVFNMIAFYDQGFDCIIATEILEHLPYENVCHALYHCLMTAPALVLTLPHGDKTLSNPEHQWEPTLAKLKHAVTATGLAVREEVMELDADFIFTVLRRC